MQRAFLRITIHQNQQENGGEKGRYRVTKKEETAETAKKTRASGRTIGNPELTEKAAKYYEETKKEVWQSGFYSCE